jgi:hypothetical protein
VTGGIDQDYAVVLATIRTVGRGPLGDAGSGYQSKGAHALDVIRAYDRLWPSNARAVSEVPHNLMIERVDLDDPVVELVGNQNITFGIESVSLRQEREGASHQDAQPEGQFFQCGGEFHDDPLGSFQSGWICGQSLGLRLGLPDWGLSGNCQKIVAY